MAKPSKDAKLQLGEPWASKLADFCAANFNAPQKEVIRKALDMLIDHYLENESHMRTRFEEARRQRLAAEKGENLKVVAMEKKG